ncbi:MAG: hypothetical protein HYR94_24185 [Chloroflexi bacterium]|nr:hypothetical protein [Chloroflexota bacterium]
MKAEDFRYSAQVRVKDNWQWTLETNNLSDAKHHLRSQVDKNPGLSARVVDKTTGETVFIDPDPDKLKIHFRENEGEDWRSLELTYVDEEGKLLHLRDGSDVGVWLSIDQVHPDDREAVLEFGKNLERREHTSEEIKMWGEFYRVLHEQAEYLRSMIA